MSKEIHKHNKETLFDIFLRDPETSDKMVIEKIETNVDDGSYSIIAVSKKGNRWKHTIKTEEL